MFLLKLSIETEAARRQGEWKLAAKDGEFLSIDSRKRSAYTSQWRPNNIQGSNYLHNCGTIEVFFIDESQPIIKSGRCRLKEAVPK